MARGRREKRGYETEPFALFVGKNVVFAAIVLFFSYMLATYRGLPNVLVVNPAKSEAAKINSVADLVRYAGASGPKTGTPITSAFGSAMEAAMNSAIWAAGC